MALSGDEILKRRREQIQNKNSFSSGDDILFSRGKPKPDTKLDDTVRTKILSKNHVYNMITPDGVAPFVKKSPAVTPTPVIAAMPKQQPVVKREQLNGRALMMPEAGPTVKPKTTPIAPPDPYWTIPNEQSQQDNTSNHNVLSSAGRHFATGLNSWDAGFMNLINKVYQAPAQLINKVIPGYYKPETDPIAKGLEGATKYYEGQTDAWRAKTQGENKALQFLGGGVEALPGIIAGAVGNAGLSSVLSTTGGFISSMPDTVAGNVANRITPMIPFGAAAAGNYAREAEKEGADYGQQVLYGIGGGLAEIVTEMIPFEGAKEILKNKGLINEGAKTLVGKYGKLGLKYLTTAAEEAMQEAAVDPMTGALKKGIYNPNMQWVGENGVIDPAMMGKDAAGGIAMAIILAPFGLSSNAASRMMAEKAVESGKPVTVEELNAIKEQYEKDIQDPANTPQEAEPNKILAPQNQNVAPVVSQIEQPAAQHNETSKVLTPDLGQQAQTQENPKQEFDITPNMLQYAKELDNQNLLLPSKLIDRFGLGYTQSTKVINEYNRLKQLTQTGIQEEQPVQQTPQHIEASSREQINKYIDNALNSVKQPQNMRIREVTNEEADKIKSAVGVDIRGYSHELSDNDIRHIINEHGDAVKEAKKGQTAITIDDIKLIPDIIDNPDVIMPGSKSGERKSIRYERRIDGHIVYVEVISSKKGTLSAKTMWKKPSAGAYVNKSPMTINVLNDSSLTSPTNPSITSNNDYNNIVQPVDNQTSTVRVNVSDIDVDPQRFQYKLDTNAETGVSKLLKNVGKWDENLAGRLTLWQDSDGKLWVVNGHHRLDLAKRLNVNSVDARILKESDGVTAKEAREIGARINIAEGRGTATDAAKLFRDGGYSISDLQERGLSLSEGTVKKGFNIAQLNDRLFMKVINKNITEDMASMIGEAFPKDNGKNDSLQNTLFDYINGEGDVTKSDIEQAINMLKNSDSYHEAGTQMSLLDNGNTVIFGDNFKYKKNIIKGVLRKLGSEKTLFRNLVNSNKASIAEKAGNILNASNNEKSQLITEKAIEFINRDSWKKGTQIGDIMNRYANNIVAGGDLKINTQGAYDEIKKVIESGDFLQEKQQEESIPGQVDIFSMGGTASEKERIAETNRTDNPGGSTVQKDKAGETKKTAAESAKQEVTAETENSTAPEDKTEIIGAESTEADSVPEPHKEFKPENILEDISDFNVRLGRGLNMTFDEAKQMVDYLLNNESAIKAELKKLKNDALRKMIPLVERNLYTTKSEMIENIYENQLSKVRYYLTGDNTISFSLGSKESTTDIYRRKLSEAMEGMDEEKFAKALEKNKAEYESAANEVKKKVESVKHPVTLDDFQTAMRFRKLTPEEQAVYDELAAVKQREKDNTKVVPKVSDVEWTIEKKKDTRDNSDLWVVKLSDRVDKDKFNELRSKMKSLGGHWSNFTNGFNFKEDPAELLNQLKTGRVEVTEETPNEKLKAAADKLRAVADNMQDAIDDKLRDNRLANTARRARMAANAEADGHAMERIQKIMRKIADAIESGEAEHLQGITARTQIQALDVFVRRIQLERSTGKKLGYEEAQKERQKPVTPEEIAAINKYPYPSMSRSVVQSLIELSNGVKGAGNARRTLQKLVNQSSMDIISFNANTIDALEKVWSLVKDKVGSLNVWGLDEYKRLQAMGIKTIEQYRAAIREYLRITEGTGMTEEEKKAQELKEKERALSRMKIEGFFPTPKPIVNDMVNRANIQPGERVLEPSAGKGNIADVIKERHPENKLDVVEWDNDLSQFLKDKGYNVAGGDFLKHTGSYDKIIMNPPFEHNQDIDHVLHAYELLKPGGRIVAIMSEHPFYANDKKSVHFREWLDEHDGIAEQMPEGSFKNAERSTGVRTRLVTIDKPGVDEEEYSGEEHFASVAGGPTIGQATGANTTGKAKRASEIFAEFGDKLDMAIKRKHRGSSLGTFNNQTYIVRIKKANDISVLSHETGHMLDRMYQLTITTDKAIRAELKKLGQVTSKPSYTPSKVRKEGIAEFTRLYLTDQAEAKAQAPETYKYFESKVSGEVIKVLQGFRDDIWNLTNLDATERVKKSIHFKGDKGQKNHVNITDTLRKIYTGLVDMTHPVEYGAGELAGKGGRKKIANMLSKFRGYEGISLYDLFDSQTDLNGQDIGESYQDIMAPVMKSEELRRDFGAYQVARRAMDYFDRGLEMPDTKETYQATIDEQEAAHPEFKDVFDKVKEFREKNTHLLVEAGIYSKEDFEKMLDNNQNYTPLKRIMEAAQSMSGSGRALNGAKKVVKKATGGGEDIIDPMESDINNTFIYRSVAIRNQILQQLADYADSATGKGYIMSKSENKIKSTTFNLEQLKKELTDQGIDLTGIDLDVMVRLWNPNYLAGPNQVVVYRGGKPALYDVHPEVYAAVSNLTPEIGNALVNTLMSIANMQKTGIIFTPKYLLYNTGRDTFHNLISTEAGINPINIIQGFYSAIVKDKYYKIAQSRGGTVNHFSANDRKFAQEAIDDMLAGQSKARKFWNTVRHPFNSFQDLIEPTEMGGRVAELKKHLKKMGHTDAEIEQAINDMRKLSIDFRRSGAWVKKMQLNRMTNFFNSQIQGMDNVVKLLVKHPIRTTLRSLIYITMPTLFLMWLNDDNDKYKELPWWRKDFFFNIPIGDPKNTNIFLPIPKPWEFGLIFGALPERMISRLKDNNPHAFDELMASLEQAVVPEFIPSAVQPILEDYGGVTWNGRPILSASDKRVSPELQYNEYTSETSKAIASITKNMPVPEALKSPKRLDHLIEGYTGTLGSIGLDSIDIALGKKDGIPVVGGLTNNFVIDAYRSPQSVNIFYNNKAALDTAYSDSKRLNTDMKPKNEALRMVYNEVYDAISLLDDLKRELEKSDKFSESDKKLKTTAINARIIELSSKVNALYDKNHK